MSTRVEQQQQQQQQQPSGSVHAGQAAALIECKFQELARKILDELKQVHYSREFFQAIDVILREPLEPHKHNKSPVLSVSRSSSRSKILSPKDLKREDDEKKEREQEKKLLNDLLVKQKEQQEQLDSHQQLLIDTQFKSLPGDDMTNTNKRNKLTHSKTTSALDKHSKQPSQQRKKSAIPQSTTLSGCQSTNSTAVNLVKPSNSLTRSATIGAGAATKLDSLVTSTPKVNAEPSKSGKSSSTKRQQPASASSLTTSEKLKQRRPTRATLSDRFQDPQDSDSSEEDDDDDDVEYQFANLAASRRSGMNEHLLASARTSGLDASKTKTTSEQTSKQQNRQVQRSSTVCGTGPIDAKEQRAKYSGLKSSVHSAIQRNGYRVDQDDDGGEPRSIGTVQLVPNSHGGPNCAASNAPVTMMYKPHMNYSTSALGNHHRLSDDDEIIIIPTTRSPTVSPALLSSRNCSPMEMNARSSGPMEALDEDLSNMDELSERFSISRTKSFWEKLTKAKMNCKSRRDGEHQLTQSPVDSSPGGPAGACMQPAVVGVRSNENSPQNKHSFKSNSLGDDAAHGNKLIGVHHHTATTQGSDDTIRRLDSSGGSGNSNYSCSSGSGDEHHAPFSQNHQREYQRRQAQLSARLSPQSLQQQPLATSHKQQMQQQQQSRTSCPKTVAAISQQLQEISRANRFRQTR